MASEPDYHVDALISTPTLSARDVCCSGVCRHRGAEEWVSITHLVFPYRGLYVRHVGGDQAVADANHVLFFNAEEAYQISHPLPGGDASLSLSLPEATLLELAPKESLEQAGKPRFRWQH